MREEDKNALIVAQVCVKAATELKIADPSTDLVVTASDLYALTYGLAQGVSHNRAKYGLLMMLGATEQDRARETWAAAVDAGVIPDQGPLTAEQYDLLVDFVKATTEPFGGVPSAVAEDPAGDVPSPSDGNSPPSPAGTPLPKSGSAPTGDGADPVGEVDPEPAGSPP
jgi:hypothetical protein